MTAAGFYHCSVKSVGRAKGRSVVAAAAYRSGTRLEDERTGEVFDYRARGGVVDTFIIAPENAPAWARDRAQLWSRAELAEGRANGRLATELELALPHELDAAQRKQLLHDFLAPITDRHGTAADVAIHKPGEGKDHRNIHAHVLLTHRMLDERGFIAKEKGQRKDAGLSVFAMGGEAVTAIRKEWEQHVNRAYERAGLDIRVDARSHKDRGIEQEPTKHLGPAANAMEQREPGSSDRGAINREIEDFNAALRELAALEIEAVIAAAALAAERQLAEMERAALDPIYDDPGDSNRTSKKKALADMDDDIIAKQREQRQAVEARQASIYHEMVADKNRAERFLQDWQRDHENGERNKRQLQEAQWQREAEGDITDVRARALIAAGESRDFEQAVRREGSMITQEHAQLQRDIALEQDPDKKHLLELRRDIQQADYMALSNERIAAMSNLNGEQYKDAMRQQEVWAQIGTDLRKERLELQERMADRDQGAPNQAVEQVNVADRQQAEHRRDINGHQPAPQDGRKAEPENDRSPAAQEAAQAQEAGQGDRRQPGQGPAAPQASHDLNGLDPDLRKALHSFGASMGHQPPETARAASGQPDRPDGDDERPAVVAEVIHSSPSRPEPEIRAAGRERSDAQRERSERAGGEEITDSKAAKKAALAQTRADIEQSIAQGHDRSHGHSR
ncbi:MAG: MobQ family relaxase [Acetobacteraceae bacterium]